jgi:hypothetical protein
VAVRLLLLTGDVHRPLEALGHIVERHQILRGIPHASGRKDDVLLGPRGEVPSIPSVRNHEPVLNAVVAL